MIIDDADPTLQTPVLLVACSRAIRMRTVRRNGVPRGARLVSGGVALTEDDSPVDVCVYRGRGPRRAAGAVDAQLLKAGAKPAEAVDTARLDESWRTVAQQRAAGRYRRMRWLFNHVQLGRVLDA